MFQGLYAVLVTPFQADGAVDGESFDRLVDFYLDRGAHGLVILSVMGEGPMLLEEERAQVVARVVERVNGRVPVVVGVNEEAEMAARMGRRFIELGASALLVAPPARLASQLEAIFEHYQTIATATKAPLVVLDYPPIVGHLPVSFIQRLTDEIDEVRAIKMEDTPTPTKIEQLRALVGDRLRILGAFGGVHCLQELKAGSDGLMTGYACPEHLIAIMHQFQAGEVAAAELEYTRWLPFLTYEKQFGLGLRKEILRQRGAIATSTVRTANAAFDGPPEMYLNTAILQAMSVGFPLSEKPQPQAWKKRLATPSTNSLRATSTPSTDSLLAPPSTDSLLVRA